MGQRRSTEGEAELDLLGPDPMVVSLVVCRAARVATAEASLHPAGRGRASVRRWLLHGEKALVAPWGEARPASPSGRRGRPWRGPAPQRGRSGGWAERACLTPGEGKGSGAGLATGPAKWQGLHGSPTGWSARRGESGKNPEREGWPIGWRAGEAVEKGSSADPSESAGALSRRKSYPSLEGCWPNWRSESWAGGGKGTSRVRPRGPSRQALGHVEERSRRPPGRSRRWKRKCGHGSPGPSWGV
jgi:hypothetical protein